jgi:hypothetical protein
MIVSPNFTHLRGEIYTIECIKFNEIHTSEFMHLIGEILVSIVSNFIL